MSVGTRFNGRMVCETATYDWTLLSIVCAGYNLKLLLVCQFKRHSDLWVKAGWHFARLANFCEASECFKDIIYLVTISSSKMRRNWEKTNVADRKQRLVCLSLLLAWFTVAAIYLNTRFSGCKKMRSIYTGLSYCTFCIGLITYQNDSNQLCPQMGTTCFIGCQFQHCD